MTDDLIFEDPPEPQRGKRGALAEWLDEVRRHPEQWVRFSEHVPTNTAATIKAGHRGRAEKGEFDAVVRKLADEPIGRGTLFVRYVGPLVDEVDS
jgi:hypothetical protein